MADSPCWFPVSYIPDKQVRLRLSFGPPDKIWSYMAWSVSMSNMSLASRPYNINIPITACELWHNKLSVEDPFGQMA